MTLFRFLRRLPLTVKMVLLTVLVGAAVGGVTTLSVRRMVGGQFEAHLQGLLEQQSREDRLHFDHYVKTFHQVARLAVSQKSFHDYLSSRAWLHETPKCRLFAGVTPSWFLNRSALRSLAVPRYIVLLDGSGRWHEAYYNSKTPPPREILEPDPLLLEKSTGQTHIATLQGTPYLMSAERLVEDAGSAILLIASPIDDRLLLATSRDTPGRLIGLVSVAKDTLLTSNDPERLPPGTPLENLRDEYVITGREYHDYGGAEMIVRVSSFMPASEIREMAAVFVRKDTQRGVAVTVVFVFSFTILMLWINRRIGALTHQVEKFSVETLGGKSRYLPSGDSLGILTESFAMLRQEVLDSHSRIRREAEELTARQLELRRQENMLSMLRSVTDAAGVGIMIRQENRFISVNTLMASWEKEFDSLSSFDVPHGRRVEKTLSDGQDIARIFHISCPILFEGHKVLIVNEITRQRHSEEEKDRLQSELAQSQRLESVGRLAGGVAHDFNNILTAINGYAELMLENLSPDDPLREKLTVILESGWRGADLTGQLLAFSRKQTINPVVINLNETVRHLQKMLSRLIGVEIGVHFTAGENLGNVMADPTQIEQVIINLAINARDAMPRGGKLRIRTENISVGGASGPESTGIEEGDYVLLTMSDTGTGMAEEVRQKIFEPFFTTKEAGKGTGLGLSMVYGIVKQSRGYIFVRSSPGAGAVFLVYLPRSAGRVKPAVEEDAGVPRGRETILLAEDQQEVRSFTAHILADLGYRVLSADDGDTALEAFTNHRGKVDLLLTDVAMPHMGGQELAATLRQRAPGIRVLYMTGGDALVEEDREEGSSPVIQKPLSVKRLAQAVRAALDGRRVTGA